MAKRSKSTVIIKKVIPSSASVSGVVGSKSTANLIKDGIDGTSRLDFVWIGDSNTGFNGFGFSGGFVNGAIANGGQMYATNIYLPYISYGELGAATKVRQFSQLSGATGIVSGIGGSSGASAALKGTFSRGSGGITTQGDTNTAPDFADAPTSRDGNNSGIEYWMYLRRDESSTVSGNTYTDPCPIGVNGALRARVTVNMRGGAGAMTLRLRNTAGGSVSATTRTLGASPNPDQWQAFEASFNASTLYNTTSGSQFIRVALDGAGDGANSRIIGPASVGLASVYAPNVVGIASNVLEYRGSATLSQISTDIEQAKTGFVKTYLQEVLNRQVAAGGSGRVVICIQGGINFGDWFPTNYSTAINAVNNIITQIKDVWSSIGGEASNIGFLFFVTHVQDSGDAQLTGLRTAFQNQYTGSNDVLFVNLNGVADYNSMLKHLWYDGTGNSHLEEANRGYDALSARMLSRIIRYAG